MPLARIAVALLLLAPASAAADPGGITQLDGPGGCASTTEIAGCASARGLDGASSIALSPTGSHAYVASRQGVTVFARDAASGALNQLNGDAGCLTSTDADGCGAADGLHDPNAIAVSPDGENVYVASYQPAAVVVFERESDGSLTQLPGCIDTLEQDPACADGSDFGYTDVAISPDGEDVYFVAALSRRVTGYRRAADGTLTALAPPGGCLVRPDGVLDPGGCLEPRAFGSPRALTFAPNGQLLVVGGQNDQTDPNGITVLDRDGTTGALSQPGGATGCMIDDLWEELADGCGIGFYLQFPTAVAAAPDGAGVHVAYGSGHFDGLDAHGYGVMTATRDLASGLLTERRPGSGFGSPPYDATAALAVSPDGRNLYGARFQFADEFGEGHGNGITAWARSGALHEVQGPTGCVSEAGTNGECADGRGLAQARDLAFSPDGRFLYAAALDPGAVTVFAREAPGPFNDVDRDGVADEADGCPSEPGTAAGCPDGDGDGVPDGDDYCLDQPGPAAESGCPAATADTTAPVGTVSVRRRSRLRKVLAKGLVRFRYGCDDAADFAATLRLPRKQARRLGIKRSIAHATSGFCSGSRLRSQTIVLKSRAKKRLRRTRRVTPTLTVRFHDAFENASRVAVKLTWKR